MQNVIKIRRQAVWLAKLSQFFRGTFCENPIFLVDFVFANYAHAIKTRCEVKSLYDRTSVGRHLAKFLIPCLKSFSLLTMDNTLWMYIGHNFLSVYCGFRFVKNPASKVEHVDV